MSFKAINGQQLARLTDQIIQRLTIAGMPHQTSLLRRSLLGVVAIGLVLAARSAFGQLPSDSPTRTNLDKAVDKAAGELFAKGQHVGLSIGIYVL
jgi:hypothetical protein